MQHKYLRLTTFTCAAALATASCAPQLDTTRQADETDFGQIVYDLACQRLAWGDDLASGSSQLDVSGSTYRDVCKTGENMPDDADPSVEALNSERSDLIAGVDTGFPSGDLDNLQAVLASSAFLSMYDDGTADKAVDRIAAFLNLMASDPATTAAMARLDPRPGYRPASTLGGGLTAAGAYPDLDVVLAKVSTAMAPGGSLHDDFAKFLAILEKELTESQALTTGLNAPDRTLNLAGNLLLTESAYLGTNTPRWLVRRDYRGMAIVALDGNALPAPFVDKNGDGLADADTNGHFIDANGHVITVPAPFATLAATDPPGTKRDTYGRAENPHNAPLYSYVDLDKTLLAAVARDTPSLLPASGTTLLDLVRGIVGVMGHRTATTRTYADGTTLAYQGFDAPTSSFLDVTYGYLNVLADPNVTDDLALLRNLVVSHQAQAAELLEAMLATADLGKQFPDAVLTPGSALYDDLIPVMNEILATPGLAEDLLRALQDPEVKNLAQRFADLMTYKDQIDYNPDTEAVVGTMHTLVDRTMSDSGFNRSLFQRILHLINDSSGWKLCNKDGALLTFDGFPVSTPYDACTLLEIDDLAVFYVQSIAYAKDANGVVQVDSEGRPLPKAVLPLNLPSWEAPLISDSIMESQSTIIGFRHHPTPEALNRVLFLDPAPGFIAATMDPPVCKDGDRYIDAHGGSLAAFELNDTYDELRPLIQPFADHNAEALFVQLLVVLHSHWPSTNSLQHQNTDPNGYGYAKESAVESYEPLIAAVVAQTNIWTALTDFAPVANSITLPSGKNAIDVLTAAARYVFTPLPGLKDREGHSTTTTEDGHPVPVLSPWYVMANAYKAKKAQVAAAGAAGQSWQAGGSLVLDVLARGTKVGTAWQFKNPRFAGESVALIDFLTARIAAHQATGDLATWLHTTLVQNISDLLTGPVFSGAVDFMTSLATAPDAQSAMTGLLSFLNTDGNPGFTPAVTMAADLLQWFADDPDLVPLLKIAGKALDAQLGLVDAQLTFVQRASAADDRKAIATLLHNLTSDAGRGKTGLAIIVDSICEVHRVNPFTDLGKPMTAADYAQSWQHVATYLIDQERGLEQFFYIVANRNLP